MKKWWLLLFVFPVIGFSEITSKETGAMLSDLSGGMYSYPSANEIPDNSVTYIQNYYTDIERMAVERNGYVKRDTTVLGNTGAVPGLWAFTDASGNDWIISFSSKTFYKNTVGNTPTAFGLNSTSAQIPDATKNLGKIWFTNGTDDLWWFDGTSTGSVSSAPHGKLIVPWRTRIVIGNITGSQSTVRFSADGDGTNWTVGGNGQDPFNIQIGGANDGQFVRCMWGVYSDSLIIGRKYDLWTVNGTTQNDYLLRNVSSEVGCLESRTMREDDGTLIFLSWRGIEEMTGTVIRLISEPVRDLTDVIVHNSLNLRTNVQTSQSDFVAGTIAPSGKLSTSIVPGSVVLSTMAVIISSDDTQADFEAGTLSNVSSTRFPGNLVLSLSADTNSALTTTGNSECHNTCTGPYYQAIPILISTPAIASAFYMRAYSEVAFPPSDYTFNLCLRNADGTIGTILQSASVSKFLFSSATSTIKVDLSSATALTAGTSYWLQLVPNGSCSESTGAKILVNGGVGSSTSAFGCGSLNAATALAYRTTLALTTFTVTGTLTSRVFDVGFDTNTWLWNWGAVTPTFSNSANISTITFETQTSSSSVGVFTSFVNAPVNSPISSTVQRFIRYRATFTTTDQSTSPVLNNISIPVGPFVSTGGVFTSQLLSIGVNISTWGPVSIADNQSSGTITYQFGSTNTASVSAITNWTNISNGGVPTVATNAFAAFRGTFIPTMYAPNLALQEFDTTWTEGGIVPSPIAFSWDRRYWLAFTTNTASGNFLDTILVWQRNKTWSLFKGINAASFANWRDSLYFGNSNSTGFVYKFDVGTADDSNNITSIIKTKSYDFSDPFRDKDFRNTFIQYTGSSTYTGTLTVGYDIDRAGGNYTLGTASMSEGSGQIAAKFPFGFSGSPTLGREVQYMLTKSDTGNRLKLHSIVVKYTLKEER